MLMSLAVRRGGHSSSSRLMARAFSTRVVLPHTSSAAAATHLATSYDSTKPQQRAFHATVSARKSAVEEDLDTALESILGEAFPASNGSKKEETKPSSTLSKVTEADLKDPEFLSTGNPRWVQAGLDQRVIDILSGKGITHFTPVQGEAFEPVLAGRDVIGRSRTGTGKTLAFGLPSITRLLNLYDEKGVRDPSGRLARGRKVGMLILCPTRELARQVQEELDQVARPLGLFTEVFHGGVSYEPQSRALRSGLDILVGTPGRVIDHIERGNLNLSECETVVLDEADEMLNMGFAEDVEVILEGVGSANQRKTQCLLFSATTPPWVKEIGKKYQDNVLAIDATGETGGARVATTVRHLAVQVPPGVESKRAALEDIIAVEISKDVEIDIKAQDDAARALENNPIAAAAALNKAKTNQAMQQKIFGKTIVFTETKREADELVSGGVFKSLTAQALHGDVGQKQRDATLNAFRAGAFNVLVATDVAARGIDIKDVDLVIQFDPPRDVDTYVHRSGRTGRAGQKGVSVLLFNPQQARDIVRIERDLGHNFRFNLVGPPSTEAALKAAAKTSAVASAGVPEETAKYFQDAAEKLLAKGEDPAHVVARCLAAISRRSADVQSRSLITGELGVATVEMANANGRPIGPNDVMFTIGKLSRMSQRDDTLSFENSVGKINANPENGKAIFDLPVEDAEKLVEFAKDIDAGGNTFKIIHEMEIERGRDFGRSWGGGGRGGGRGGSFERYGRGGGRGYSDRRGGGGRGGGSYQGGGGYQGRSNNFRPRNPDRQQDGTHGRSFRGRYDSQTRPHSEGRRHSRPQSDNDGW
eukprot:scaffold1992_cov187-Amphora_coffeaeformis.AAC.18